MSIFRTIAMFIYLFGYMIVHYGVLRRAERALAAGNMQLVEELVNKHIPHWSRGILKVTGVSLVVEGLENIPKDTACVFVGNQRTSTMVLWGAKAFQLTFRLQKAGMANSGVV